MGSFTVSVSVGTLNLEACAVVLRVEHLEVSIMCGCVVGLGAVTVLILGELVLCSLVPASSIFLRIEIFLQLRVPALSFEAACLHNADNR